MFIIDKEQEICMFSLHVLIVHIDSVVFWQLSVLGNQVTDFPSISDDFKHQDPFNQFENRLHHRKAKIFLHTICTIGSFI